MNKNLARTLLREAVALNIQHRKTGRDGATRFSEERDGVAASLRQAGFPANYQDYQHPSDVE